MRSKFGPRMRKKKNAAGLRKRNSSLSTVASKKYAAMACSPKIPTTNTTCCGSKPINDENDLCCGDEIMSYNDEMRCCAGEKFSPHEQLCDVDLVDGKIVDILVDVTDNHTETCNKTKYDFETHACCWSESESNDVRVEIVEKNSSLRNIRFPDCCENPISKKFVPYDTESHVCCKTTGQLLKIPRDKKNSDEVAKCCNDELYYNHSFIECCDNKLVERIDEFYGFCCGNKMLFDESAEICCNGVISKNDVISDCCNGEMIDTYEYLCCNGKRENGDDIGCCHGEHDRTVFDTRIQECAGGGVVQREPEDIERMATADPLCYRHNK